MPRIGRDLEQDRGITRGLHCAGCGYSLRTRPTVGRCPECGGEYDARPLGRRGILQPQDIRFPFDNYALGMGTGAGGLLLLSVTVYGGERWCLWASIPLLLFAPFFLLLAVRQTIRRRRLRALIRAAESDDDA